MVTPLETDDTSTLGPYRLLRQLGDSGVFLGLPPDGQAAAVQAIPAELAADPGFRDEVAAARTVSAAFVAPVVDADLDGPAPWLASMYVAGPSLAEAVREHRAVAGSGRARAGGRAGRGPPRHACRGPAAPQPQAVERGTGRGRAEAHWLHGIWNAAELPGKDPGFLSPEQVLAQDFAAGQRHLQPGSGAGLRR